MAYYITAVKIYLTFHTKWLNFGGLYTDYIKLYFLKLIIVEPVWLKLSFFTIFDFAKNLPIGTPKYDVHSALINVPQCKIDEILASAPVLE